MAVRYIVRPRWDASKDALVFIAQVGGCRFCVCLTHGYLTRPYARQLDEGEARRLFDERRPAIEDTLEVVADECQGGRHLIFFETEGIPLEEVAT